MPNRIRIISFTNSAIIKYQCLMEGGKVLPLINALALALRAGSSQTDCRIKIRIIMTNHWIFKEVSWLLLRTIPIQIKIAKAHSTLLRALNTSLPMFNPTGIVRPGARNLSQDSIKLMAPIKPAHRKEHIIIIKNKIVILNYLGDYF